MADQYDFEELYANTYTEADQRAYESQPTSEKRFVIAWLLTLLMGPAGAHRWYLNRPVTASLMVLVSIAAVALMVSGFANLGLLCITIIFTWTLIDLIMLLAGSMRDRADLRLAGHRERAGVCSAITMLLLAVGLVFALVVGTSSGVAG
ncbi:TM2 domain-containing protein [Nesterenkonia sp. LB17]|uniref:TM2 domain-containing protein n=1 Tax=unclassified Nesterenkonia TaxID=2629769 RepID=UPI001F4CD2DA|nr:MULTISPECIES: TM2 domain-containing protein [unclassified Nesterenkonia]MCH8561921.1 TM2 domain-containing protein [Nesterenkonia sp. YGD6]MCH8564542.1 TM2 domain-containing protein [Nesterenkonia sp. LB17]